MSQEQRRKLPAYKITCENGFTWETNMATHVTLEIAEKYFLGKQFNTAPFPGEVFSEAVKVEKLA